MTEQLTEWDHLVRSMGYIAIAGFGTLFVLCAVGSVWLAWEKANGRICDLCLAPKSGYNRRCVRCQRAVDDARWHAELRKHKTAEGREEIA